jgi:ribosome small subunit-dependent GTPase A
LRCSTRKNLPRTVCGDRVHWQAANPREGIITAVLDRETTLSRPDPNGRSRSVAANIDQVIVVIACKPSFEHGMLDRYLAAAELIGASPVIVVNKSDLLDADSRTKLQQRLAVYPAIGYSLVFTSTRNTDGLKDLHRHLAGHTSILVGQSGVGKSSLVQALLPDLDIRTGSLSQATGLGRHTTTVAMLYHVPGGGDRFTWSTRFRPRQGRAATAGKGFPRVRSVPGPVSFSQLPACQRARLRHTERRPRRRHQRSASGKLPRTGQIDELTGRPVHPATCQQVQVDMEYRLPAIGITVHDSTVTAAIHARARGDACGGLHHLPHQQPMRIIHIIQRGDMLFGDHQYVQRCLGVDVTECQHLVVLVDFIRLDFTGHHFAEQAIGHGNSTW